MHFNYSVSALNSKVYRLLKLDHPNAYSGIPILYDTDKILKVKYMYKMLSNIIWANLFMRSSTLSNGMPIYSQTVQYIWSKCAANIYGQVWLVQTIVKCKCI